ncbi:MAG: hypothetical protein J6V00_01705, partial [Bacteroidaceae bacterium]|nr:hypothetical protein [Bacteroidaceae bacterium]
EEATTAAPAPKRFKKARRPASHPSLCSFIGQKVDNIRSCLNSRQSIVNLKQFLDAKIIKPQHFLQ